MPWAAPMALSAPLQDTDRIPNVLMTQITINSVLTRVAGRRDSVGVLLLYCH